MNSWKYCEMCSSKRKGKIFDLKLENYKWGRGHRMVKPGERFLSKAPLHCSTWVTKVGEIKIFYLKIWYKSPFCLKVFAQFVLGMCLNHDLENAGLGLLINWLLLDTWTCFGTAGNKFKRSVDTIASTFHQAVTKLPPIVHQTLQSDYQVVTKYLPNGCHGKQQGEIMEPKNKTKKKWSHVQKGSTKN